MRILVWLLVPAAITLLAMAWALWAGRPARELTARERAEATERLGRALSKPYPQRRRGLFRRRVQPDLGAALAPTHFSGVVVRRPRAD